MESARGEPNDLRTPAVLMTKAGLRTQPLHTVTINNPYIIALVEVVELVVVVVVEVDLPLPMRAPDLKVSSRVVGAYVKSNEGRLFLLCCIGSRACYWPDY